MRKEKDIGDLFTIWGGEGWLPPWPKRNSSEPRPPVPHEMSDRDITYLKSITVEAKDRGIELPALYEPGGILYEVITVLNDGNNEDEQVTWRHDAAEKAFRLCKLLKSVTVTSDQVKAHCKVHIAAVSRRGEREREKKKQRQSAPPLTAPPLTPLRRSARHARNQDLTPASHFSLAARKAPSSAKALISPAHTEISAPATVETSIPLPITADHSATLPKTLPRTTLGASPTSTVDVDDDASESDAEPMVDESDAGLSTGAMDNRRSESPTAESDGFVDLSLPLTTDSEPVDPTDGADKNTAHPASDSVDDEADTYTSAIFTIGDDSEDGATLLTGSDVSATDLSKAQKATVIAAAQVQLDSLTTLLSDTTIEMLQSVIWEQAKATRGDLETTVQLVDPLYVQVESKAFEKNMPKLFSRQLKASCILVPLHHHKPHHWTLAVVNTAFRQIFWYDSAPCATRTESTKERLRRWAAFAIPGEGSFQHFQLVCGYRSVFTHSPHILTVLPQ